MQSTDRPVVQLSGDYDLSRREEMRDDLYVLEDEDATAVDLADVKYMDSTSLGVLVNFNRRFIHKGGAPIKLLNLQPRLCAYSKSPGSIKSLIWASHWGIVSTADAVRPNSSGAYCK